nr:ComEC/Rec2 family competence protein [Solirubrobacterales bacterium]
MNRRDPLLARGGRHTVEAIRGARVAISARPRHVVLASIIAGLLIGPVWAPGVLLAALAALALGGRASVALVAAAAVMGGAAFADARLAALSLSPARGLVGEAVNAKAVLLEPARERSTGMRAARVRLLNGRAARAVVVARVDPGSPWPREAQVGDVLAIEGRLVPLARYEAYQRRRGAPVALEVQAASATATRRSGLAGALDSTRRRAERALATGVPPSEAAMLRGMVLGQDEGIEEPVREEFRRSGLAHLLAASGQNVMLLVILAVAAATAVGAGLRARLAIALLLVVLYVPLAGGGPSIQRAGVMGAAGLVAALAGRPASRWYAVGLAAALTLALDPRVAGEPGWQLSFAAVLALLLFAPPLRSALTRRRWPQPLADATAITAAATAGTAPLMALHFETVSLASLPANLLVAPAVAPVMWLGMLAGTVGQISMNASAPFSGIAAYPVAYVEWVAHIAAGYRSASVEVHVANVVVVALAYAGMGATALAARAAARRTARLSVGVRRRASAVGLLGAALLAAVVIERAGPPPRSRNELVVSFLEVGQGDATLLQHRDTAVLVDTGPPGGPILQRLREAGVRRLDALVLTHAQADHEGMAAAVLQAHPTRLVINGGAGRDTSTQRSLTQLLARTRARTLVPAAGQLVTVGAVRIHILWPPEVARGAPPEEGDPNLRAMVAHVSLGDFDLLLPADAESEVTAALELPR